MFEGCFNMTSGLEKLSAFFSVVLLVIIRRITAKYQIHILRGIEIIILENRIRNLLIRAFYTVTEALSNFPRISIFGNLFIYVLFMFPSWSSEVVNISVYSNCSNYHKNTITSNYSNCHKNKFLSSVD